MKDIFKNMGEWDWFEKDKSRFSIREDGIVFRGMIHYSLPDLLANPSWCKAVWLGSVKINGEMKSSIHFSVNAFQILQQEGHQACLIYIKNTMI